MSEQLTNVERGVLEMILAGENSDLEILRNQLSRTSVSKREDTGVGFFSHLELPCDIQRIQKKKRVTLHDISAQLPGLKNGAGFVLFIEEGAISLLEGFSYDEEWPESTSDFTLSSLREFPHGSGSLIPSVERDLDFAFKDFAK